MTSGLDEKLRVLRQRYEESLSGNLAELEECWRAVDRADGAADGLRELHAHLHHLSGSGATFGFAEVSNIAERLETTVLAVLHEGKALDGTVRSEIRDGLRELRQAAARG